MPTGSHQLPQPPIIFSFRFVIWKKAPQDDLERLVAMLRQAPPIALLNLVAVVTSQYRERPAESGWNEHPRVTANPLAVAESVPLTGGQPGQISLLNI
jgi:hypothetical protein